MIRFYFLIILMSIVASLSGCDFQSNTFLHDETQSDPLPGLVARREAQDNRNYVRMEMALELSELSTGEKTRPSYLFSVYNNGRFYYYNTPESDPDEVSRLIEKGDGIVLYFKKISDRQYVARIYTFQDRRQQGSGIGFFIEVAGEWYMPALPRDTPIPNALSNRFDIDSSNPFSNLDAESQKPNNSLPVNIVDFQHAVYIADYLEDNLNSYLKGGIKIKFR